MRGYNYITAYGTRAGGLQVTLNIFVALATKTF